MRVRAHINPKENVMRIPEGRTTVRKILMPGTVLQKSPATHGRGATGGWRGGVRVGRRWGWHAGTVEKLTREKGTEGRRR